MLPCRIFLWNLVIFPKKRQITPIIPLSHQKTPILLYLGKNRKKHLDRWLLLEKAYNACDIFAKKSQKLVLNFDQFIQIHHQSRSFYGTLSEEKYISYKIFAKSSKILEKGLARNVLSGRRTLQQMNWLARILQVLHYHAWFLQQVYFWTNHARILQYKHFCSTRVVPPERHPLSNGLALHYCISCLSQKGSVLSTSQKWNGWNLRKCKT